MLRDDAAIREVSSVIEIAAQSVLDDYLSGDAPQEVDITGRLVGAIKYGLDGKVISGIRWRAKTLKTGRGRSAEERRIGADLVGVLDINLPSYRAKKGFLIQAKRAEPGQAMPGWTDLERQAGDMLNVSPDSFVMLYSKKSGIRIVPAVSVAGLTSKDPFDLYHQSLGWFFEQHLKCFIGDRNIDAGFVDRVMATPVDGPIDFLIISAYQR